jgi:RNA polymerase sigma-70 factor (ECF subfamily)
MTSEKLVKKAQNGNKEAFNELIIYYEKDLYNIAKSRLNNEDDVCDAIQETILIAYKSIKKLLNPSKFKIWLIKILINECNKIYKNQKNDLYDSQENLESLAYNKTDSNLEFLSLMNVLDQDEKNIFILYYQEGYTSKEISKILNINQNTIRSKLSRGKEKIKNNLKEVL